ncbi:MAG: hypothetical protein C0404_07375 [Verrucomicrobia bacterium]|nr:hypothetical protein [Verrucomicrobiota bacterium]
MPDLRVMLGDRTEAALYKRLNGLVEAGILLKVKRGIYATPEASLAAISNRIEPAAYVSTGTILAKCAAIGSVPARRIQAVKTGRPRTYVCKLGVIEHLSLSPQLYFGFEPADGILYATPEKAFLDVCYYTYRGKRFSFDPESDVNVSDLKRHVVYSYLRKYDRRFVDYFNRIWGDKWLKKNRS